MASSDLLRKVLDSNTQEPYSGTVMEYPVVGETGHTKHGVGLMRDDTTQKYITFHVRDLVNGNGDNLKPETRLSYRVVHSARFDPQPTDIRFVCLEEQHGSLHTYNEENGNGIIKTENDMKQFVMEFNNIIGRVPEKFMPGLRVTFTRDGNFATDVRFVHLPVCWGKIKFYDAERKFGFIVPDAGGKDVVFMKAAVVNIAEVHSASSAELLGEGAPVTYELQRVPPIQRERHGKRGLKGTNVCLQHPSLAVIQSVIHSGPHDPLAVASCSEPILCRARAGEQPESSAVEAICVPTCSFEVEEVAQQPSEVDLSLSSSYLNDGSLVRLSFSRDPTEFHRALAQHPELSFRLEGGAYIFAPPIYHAGIRAISHVLKLSPWDVLVTQELETGVRNSLTQLPRKYKISIKDSHAFHIKTNDQDKERDEWHITVKKTFINFSVPKSPDGSTVSAN